MKHQYGEFSRQGDEYIINRPDTPIPWFNTLSSSVMTSRISATGEGEIVTQVSGRAVTRTLTDSSTPHRPARHFYMRDNDTGESWRIGEQSEGSFTATHALGNTRIHYSGQDIDTSLILFLPPDDPCEIWQIKVRNTTSRKRRLSVFAVVEWFCRDMNQHQTELYDNVLLATDRVRAGQPLAVNFLAGDHAFDSFDTLESIFLGRDGSYAAPLAVADGRCSRSLGSGSWPIAAWQKNLTLAASSETNFNLMVGQVTGNGKTIPLAEQNARGQIKRLVAKYRRPQAITEAFEAITQTKNEHVRRNLAKSPDPLFDYLFNYWTTHQALSLAQDNSLTPSTLDLVPVLAAHDPMQARRLLENALTRQHKDGRIFDIERNDISQSLVRGVILYLQETADFSWLDEQINYEDSAEGSVQQHLVRAVDQSIQTLSRRHLPVTQHGQAFGGEQQREDQVHACRLHSNLRLLAPILDAVGEHELVRKYERVSGRLREAINEHFWDGAWYGGSLSAGKKTTGFKKNDYQKIGLAEQAWAVISGAASAEQGKKALTSMHTHLDTKFGLATLWPVYPCKTDEPWSEDTPGTDQNGGISIGENALAVAATAQLGDGDMAYKLWQRSSPAYLANQPEQYAGAPFTYADSLYGPAHPLFGRVSGQSTGSAVGLMWQSCSWYMLGIQPVLGGLKLDPCLPRDWRQVEVTRRFRDAEYHIRILNSFRQNRGVDRILVNGVRITGNVIPVQGPGVHFVEVVIG